ncbi:BQ5605_C002g01108 [Microbotryum silenes-dioicae]|uniref:BQ5605_C002g01108 protein n=1 Tax=Microbotryum silenes-dioicae TaxID=796604 RepID=A0A2X0P119_9BASI|nr:BQ5605_C002g01108 [Microbotryum silenes-dioicae]
MQLLAVLLAVTPCAPPITSALSTGSCSTGYTKVNGICTASNPSDGKCSMKCNIGYKIFNGMCVVAIMSPACTKRSIAFYDNF